MLQNARVTAFIVELLRENQEGRGVKLPPPPPIHHLFPLQLRLGLVYINYLADGLSSNTKLFADDTSLFSVIHNYDLKT